MSDSTLTERGQISIPASLRKSMNLKPGQKLRFTEISESEFRVTVYQEKPVGPVAVLGYARRLRPDGPRTTTSWMKELREGEA
jgi:AbrB family looped-hinge helix DNA binding protein